MLKETCGDNGEFTFPAGLILPVSSRYEQNQGAHITYMRIRMVPRNLRSCIYLQELFLLGGKGNE